MFKLTSKTSINDLRDADVDEVITERRRLADVWPDAAAALNGLDAMIRMDRLPSKTLAAKLNGKLGDLVDEWNAPNLDVYTRIERELPGLSRDEVETADAELRRFGLATQTYGDAAVIAKVLVNLGIVAIEENGLHALAGTLPSAR